MSLEGRIALVTGSARNIGRTIALRLAQDGADVFIHDRPGEAGIEKVVAEVEALGRRAWGIEGDLRKYDHIRRIFSQVNTATGQLDILINNAAMGAARGVLKIKPNHWDLTLEISAKAVVFCSQEASKLMTGGWGRIVNLSSLGSRRYLPDYVAIGASKAVVENVTRALAVELADRGINVNCVCGGMIASSTLDHLGPSIQDQIKLYEERCPKGRLGRPEDLAKVVSFLCSEDSSWVLGQTIVADGGYSLW